ncbi:MAG: SPOR domain-containing protein [Pseudomonadota bacterium]
MSDYMRNRRGEEGDSFFCRFTFGQFFALLVLEVFTLFFVFYLGARYGREFLGLGKSGLAVASESKGETAEADAPKVATTDDPEAAQMAKDLIAKAQTPELKDRISRMFEGAKRQPEAKAPPVVGMNREDEVKTGEVLDARPSEQGRAERPEAVPREAPVDKAEAQTAEHASAERQSRNEGEGKASSDTSVVRVKSVENARYSVQIGSYPQMGEATRIVDKWKGKGYPAYVMIADIPDRGRWYRVRIGGFGTREDATRYLKEFQSRESVEALIVMNEQ